MEFLNQLEQVFFFSPLPSERLRAVSIKHFAKAFQGQLFQAYLLKISIFFFHLLCIFVFISKQKLVVINILAHTLPTQIYANLQYLQTPNTKS